MFNKLRDYDFYRKIPKDLTETSLHGSILSVCASLFMLVLFIAELWAFLSPQVITNTIIDPNTDSLLRINFNITVMDLPCEFATIDVVDVLGTRKENVTKNINKWQVDESGNRRGYEGRNIEQKDIMHDVHHDLHQLQSNGIHAVPLDMTTYRQWLDDHEYVFANFYAPWCIWCQRLEPVWEAFAERIESDQTPVSVVSIDCTANMNLCMDNHIQAFPSLRLFKHGEFQSPDYRSDRTVDALLDFVHSRLATDEQLALLDPKQQQEHHERILNEKKDHPGCLLAGYLLVNRVPGNFHIEARSKHHNMNAAMANLSHIVNHFSFGNPHAKAIQRRIEELPNQYFSLESTKPMDGYMYLAKKLHQSYHHYIKVVSTQLELGSRYMGSNAVLVYQMVQSSQVMQYQEEEVPEARFSYDISPMAVVVSKKGKHWYEFITSICALIGGTFTVVGLLSSFLGVIFKSKKI